MAVEISITLIVIACIVPVVLIGINFVLLAFFIHEKEMGGTKLPKLVIMFGLLFAECTVLLLPLDVGNRSGMVGCGFWNQDCGGLDLALVWQIVYIGVAVMVVVIIPFAIFYYEADDGEGNKGEFILWTAIKYWIVTLVLAVATILITYIFLRYTYIPVDSIVIDINNAGFNSISVPLSSASACGAGTCTITKTHLSMSATFVVYLASIISFVGWFLFVIYGAVGLIALPMDNLNAFFRRRKLLSPSVVARHKKALQERANNLLAVLDKLKEEYMDVDSTRPGALSRLTIKRERATQMNELSTIIRELEKEHEDLMLSSPEMWAQNNQLVPWLRLVGGLIGIVISLVWLAQVIIYLLVNPAVTPNMNDYLQDLDSFFPLFGTLTIALFAMYLLVCIMMGNYKVGMRFFLVSIHPMEPHKTFLNSFMFNVGLVLMCCLPVTQFCTMAFRSYCRMTDADVIFGSQAKNMEFFRYFWQNNVFIYALLAICGLALIYLIACPSDRARAKKAEAAKREEYGQARDKQLKDMSKRRK